MMRMEGKILLMMKTEKTPSFVEFMKDRLPELSPEASEEENNVVQWKRVDKLPLSSEQPMTSRSGLFSFLGISSDEASTVAESESVLTPEASFVEGFWTRLHSPGRPPDAQEPPSFTEFVRFLLYGEDNSSS